MEIAEVSDPSVSSDWTPQSTTLKIMLDAMMIPACFSTKFLTHPTQKDREQRLSLTANVLTAPILNDGVDDIWNTQTPHPRFGCARCRLVTPSGTPNVTININCAGRLSDSNDDFRCCFSSLRLCLVYRLIILSRL